MIIFIQISISQLYKVCKLMSSFGLVACKNRMKNTIIFASFYQRVLAKSLDIFISGIFFSGIFLITLAIWFVVQPSIPAAQTTFNTGLVAEKGLNSNNILDFWIQSANQKGECDFTAQEYQNACKTVLQFNQQVAIATTIISLIAWILYTILPVAFMGGTTLGKYIVGIRIVATVDIINVKKVGLLRSFTREIFAGISLIIAGILPIFTYLTNFSNILEISIVFESYWILFTPKKQAIHDKIAQTYVVTSASV